MAWKYCQSTGQLYHEGELIATGYSGHGDGKNCSAMQDKHNVGPLPRGVYAIGKPHDTTSHGPFVMALMPFGPPPEWNPSEEERAEYDRLNQPEHLAGILSGALAKFSWMFGRDGFLIHGDSIVHTGQASQGCIILPRSIREQIAASEDDELEVTV